MAIDTQELRRKVNSTDILDHIDLHANIKPFLSEMIDRLEAAEKERDAARDLADRLALALNTSNHERDNLRAKIAEMERQYPICRIKDIRRAHYMTKVVGLDPEAWLYALPGAKGEEK